MLTDKEHARTIHLFSAVEVLFHFGLCFLTAVSPFVPASRLPCQRSSRSCSWFFPCYSDEQPTGDYTWQLFFHGLGVSSLKMHPVDFQPPNCQATQPFHQHPDIHQNFQVRAILSGNESPSESFVAEIHVSMTMVWLAIHCIQGPEMLP